MLVEFAPSFLCIELNALEKSSNKTVASIF